MFGRRIYYILKPFVPWRVRMAVRRFFSRWKRKSCGDIWPIDESAARPPEGWPGWPEGKKFAFVLTHDVEGPEGLEKCRQLAELEIELGFRSSFNFIPEGPYVVPPDLRAWLTERGFEVGVHDQAHDGKLFRSRKDFIRKAGRINRYLKDWGATGFRAGFMLHQLGWLHALDIQYDASTFDTDPFEPQPDGMGTIFPFWVQRPEQQSGKRLEQSAPYPLPLIPLPLDAPRAGYVELPYTLSQDSTLFLVFQETTPEIWLRKLDWVAAHGGMALVNVHPDYVCFDGEKSSTRTYAAAHYRRLLEHVRQQYAGVFWQPLPREVARCAAQPQPWPATRRPKRVCMVTYSHYETDNRVRRFAETLALRGDEVDVFSVSSENDHARKFVLNGVSVARLSRKRKFGENTPVYIAQLIRFFFGAFGAITARALARPYDVVHVHNMPDFIVFTAIVARLRGAKVILDLHDLVPELYADKKPGWRQSFAGYLLRWEEKISARFAQHLIISNHLWLKTVTGRSAATEKCSVFVNSVDSRIFFRRKRLRSDERHIILFHGTLSRHQGVDLVIQAMPKVLPRLPKAEFHIYGVGSELENLKRLARDLGVEKAVRFHDGVTLDEIPQVIADADVGVVAKRADSFGNLAYSTKILEFMSQGIPVVLARTEIDQYYFDETVARFFPSGDVPALADALVEVLLDSELRDRLTRNATDYVQRNSWLSRKQAYFALVDALCDRETVVPSV
jgi:glycosyltransferase involved in cell wall biosynthesis